MDKEEIKGLISGFSNMYNAFYSNPRSERNNYHHWPQGFSGEKRKIAKKIYDSLQKMTAVNSGLTFRITPDLEEKILKNVLVNIRSQ